MEDHAKVKNVEIRRQELAAKMEAKRLKKEAKKEEAGVDNSDEPNPTASASSPSRDRPQRKIMIELLSLQGWMKIKTSS